MLYIEKRHARVKVATHATVISLLICFFAATPAWATTYINQGGYGYNTTVTQNSFGQYLDGWQSDIEAVGPMSPYATHCLVFSITTASQGIQNKYQIETGLDKCGASASTDGQCSVGGGQYQFVEVYIGYADGSEYYHCYQHDVFHVNANYTFKNIRYDSDTWYAYLNGTRVEGLSGFNRDDINAYSWAESTGSVPCWYGWSGEGAFASTYWYNTSTGFHVPANPGPTYFDNGYSCWNVTSFSNGGFYAYHP